MDKKISRVDAELNKYRDQMRKMRDGPAKVLCYINLYLCYNMYKCNCIIIIFYTISFINLIQAEYNCIILFLHYIYYIYI